jgi:outer membrane lipoprotein-sorting protein
MKIFILLLFSLPIFANNWDNFMSSFNTLQADFQQISDGEISYGTILLNKNKRQLKIHTLKPYEQIITLNTNKIISYDIWLKTANIIYYKHNDFIELLFNAKTPTQLTADSYYYGNILLQLENNKLKSIVRRDENTQVNIFLEKLTLNPLLKNDDFIINFPEDVDLLDETY